MPLTYTNIASTTLASAASTVTLSSIPGTYTDLMLICSLRGDRGVYADPIQITLNEAFTGAAVTYSYTNFTSNAGGRTSTRGTADSRIYVDETIPQAGFFNSTATFNTTQVYFPNYTTSAPKVVSLVAGWTSINSSIANGLTMTAGRKNDASAISSIILSSNGFVIGTSLYLYGIKNS